MNDKDLINTATKLKCNTGNEIDTIGMKYETSKITLNIYGEHDSDHEMIVDQFVIKKKNKWVDVKLNEAQLKILEIIFRAEVKKVNELHKIQDEADREQEQYAKDVDRYGMAGALYSKFY